MTRSLRAVARIAASVLHGFHGLALVLLRFPALDAAGRHARIGRWSLTMLRRMGITLQVDGVPATGGVLVAANHVSWLDILALHAACPQARFVSKADVRGWPLVARLADAADTLYLERERKRDALRVVHAVAAALQGGQTVAVFPEGTTADGRTLLPFHANLLQAAIAVGAPVQPVALRFSDAHDAVSRAVEFVGRTTLVQSLWRVARADALQVRLVFLPLQPTGGADRRELATRLHDTIGARLDALAVSPP